MSLDPSNSAEGTSVRTTIEIVGDRSGEGQLLSLRGHSGWDGSIQRFFSVDTFGHALSGAAGLYGGDGGLRHVRSIGPCGSISWSGGASGASSASIQIPVSRTLLSAAPGPALVPATRP
jgi:hypothetical protein